jgi:hypothetical protein
MYLIVRHHRRHFTLVRTHIEETLCPQKREFCTASRARTVYTGRAILQKSGEFQYGAWPGQSRQEEEYALSHSGNA